jgi:hypothetical protein
VGFGVGEGVGDGDDVAGAFVGEGVSNVGLVEPAEDGGLHCR